MGVGRDWVTFFSIVFIFLSENQLKKISVSLTFDTKIQKKNGDFFTKKMPISHSFPFVTLFSPISHKRETNECLPTYALS